jgi:tetratricopeptide (TPR) repeat protein
MTDPTADTTAGNNLRTTVTWYAVAFVVALAVRVLYLAGLWDSALLAVVVGDGRQYMAWALEIADGGWLGDRVFYQAPLYPYAMAVVFHLFGPELAAVRILQIILGSAACVLLTAAGRRFFSTPVGVVAGLLLALYPPALFFDGIVQKTSVGLFLLCALLAVAATIAGAREDPRWWTVAGAGVLLGLLGLIRENALILAPVLAGWLLWLPAPGARGRWLRVAVFGAGLAAVLLPVGFRNLHVDGQFLLTTSQLGPNFYIGNHAGADGRYRPLVPGHEDARVERLDARRLAEDDLGRELTPREVSRYWLDRSWRDIASDPLRWLRLEATKIMLLLNASEIVDTESLEAYRRESRVLSALGWLHFGVIAPFAAAGVWFTRHRWRRLAVLHAIALAIALSLLLFYVMGRYRFSLVPIVLLFAGAGLAAMAGCVRNRDWRPLLQGLVVVAAAAVVHNWPIDLPSEPLATSYYNVGVSLFETGDDTRALQYLEKAEALVPDAAPIQDHLGRVHAALGDPERAAEHFRRAAELRPGDTDQRRRLAGALADAGRVNEAIRVYQEIITLGRANPDDHGRLGYLLLGSGDLAAAEEQLRVAVDLDPEAALARNLLANILAEHGDLEKARQLYIRALALDPELADAHFKLGMLDMEKGRLGEARDHLATVTELLPTFADGHLRLAEVLERLGETDAAAAHHQRVLELRPGDPDATRALQRLR